MKTHLGNSCRGDRQSGFSLLEVLIAIVITSIGLLGLAAMQATGLRNNHSAYHRSQATVLAYDIADRMRSNASSMASYITAVDAGDGGEGTTPPDGGTPSVAQAVPGGQSPDSIQVEGDGDTGGDDTGDGGEEVDPLAGCKTTGGCSVSVLAQSDLAQWNADLATALPGGTGSIAFDNATNIFTISVNWDDNRDGLVDVNDPGLRVSFQP